MTEETKKFLQLHFTILKQAVKDDGCMFGILIDDQNPEDSKLVVMDREKYLRNGERDGFSISLTELNS